MIDQSLVSAFSVREVEVVTREHRLCMRLREAREGRQSMWERRTKDVIAAESRKKIFSQGQMLSSEGV